MYAEIEPLDQEPLNTLMGGLKVQFNIGTKPQSVVRRLEDRKWQSALVMGELIRFYLKQSRRVE